MPDIVAPEYARLIAAERRAGRLPELPGKPLAAGEAYAPVVIDVKQASELLRVAAKRAAGLFRPTERTEVVWVDGDRELAVNLLELQVKFAEGAIRVVIPVRSDQTGAAVVEVLFAVGAPGRP